MSYLKQVGTPIFYAEGEPKGVTRVNYKLEIDGLIKEKNKVFDFREIEKMPLSTVDARLTSVSGWSVRAGWQGLPFFELMKYINVEEEADHVLFESFGGYTTSIPIEELMYEKVLLCYKVDGEYLEIEYGGPVRLFVPQLWGYKSIKGLKKMTFMKGSALGYWETRGYSDEAEIEPGFTMDVNSSRRRRIKGGEVTEF